MPCVRNVQNFSEKTHLQLQSLLLNYSTTKSLFEACHWSKKELHEMIVIIRVISGPSTICHVVGYTSTRYGNVMNSDGPVLGI